MTIKTVLWMAAVLALTPAFSIAQGVHSQFAVGQPSPSFTPTQAPAIATRIPFANLRPGSSPIAIIQAPVIAPVIVQNPIFVPSQSFFPNQTVVIPNQVFIPNQVSTPIPSQVMLPPTQLLLPGQTVIPAAASQPVDPPVRAYFGLPTLPAPADGTSRADVLRQFGQPIVTVATSRGETLYFSDGTRVTLQNGQVTGSK